jgi:DNA-binding CsgD family transcriptional regulator
MPGPSDGLPAFNVMARAPAHIRFLLVTGDGPGAARAAAGALAAYEGRRLDFVVALRAAEGLFADGRADELARLRDTVDATPGLGGTAWADLIAGHALLCTGLLGAARSSLSRAASRFAAASYQQHYARCLAMLAIAGGDGGGGNGGGGSGGGSAGGGAGEAGAALAGEALGILTGIGAHGTAAEISRLAASRGIATDQAAGSLSPREREILRLLAQGMRNADIAAALSISQHTVASHLDRIRDKTCRRRRAELTRFAMELGLVDGRG